MPKKSVLGHPDNVPKLAREGFSLDQQFTFTASTGMLLPVWYDFLNPGESLKGYPSFLIRTENFLAPAMADIDCFVDLFFVPMNKILSSFGEWFFQINDIRSDYVDVSNLSEYLPVVSSSSSAVNPFAGFTKSGFNALLSDDIRSRYTEQYFDSFGFGLHRLLFHFGYNPQSIFYTLYANYANQDEVNQQVVLSKYADLQLNFECPNFSPYWFAAYQGIYYDYYRNSEYEENNVKAYNLDTIFADGTQEIDLDQFINSASSTSRRTMFELRYRWRNRDYFMSTRMTPLINSVSMLPNAVNHLSEVNQWLTQSNIAPKRADLSAPQSDDRLPGDNATQYGIKLSNGGILSVGQPNYADGQVTQLFDTSGEENDVEGYLSALNTDPSLIVNADELTLQLRTPHSHSLVNQHYSILSTAQIRTMFALEKLSRITQRAGKHYDDQTLAHFGFKVNKGLSGEVYKIGSYHTMLGIQKVTSMADTQGAALGEQAGVGFGLLDGSRKKFKFTAPCHGIVMAIWSAAPRYKYIGTVDKLGMKTTLWDFFKPSLDNLGSQPLFAYENPYGKTTGTGDLNTTLNGWQWRFMESKVKFDRVAPVFATTGKNPWSMVAFAESPVTEGKVSPCDINDLLNAQYDPSPLWPEQGAQDEHETWVTKFVTAYLRDPFVIDFKMKCSKVSTMSTFGDVSLNGI